MEYAGGGDPARTMALLWRTAEAPRRGPRQRLDLNQIVGTAIALADGDPDGLAAVSVRRVAQALGIAPSSLYTYVSKAQLLELMVDQAIGTQPLPGPGEEWRPGLEAYAWSGLELHRRHPWLLQVATARTVFGPHLVARYDAVIGLLDRFGLAPVDVERCVAAVDGYIRGAAAEVVEAEQAPLRTGRTDDEWWAAYAPVLDQHLAEHDFPHLAALDRAGGFLPSADDLPYTVQRALDRFAFGLALTLDGIGQRIGAPRDE